MAEKKRVRPTWEQVRKLEAEIAELKSIGEMDVNWLEEKKQLEETIHMQCQELRGWKEQYDELSKKCESTEKPAVMHDMEEACKKLEAKCATLEESNRLMEEELSRVKHANEELGRVNTRINEELTHLKSRGFWERLFNASV